MMNRLKMVVLYRLKVQVKAKVPRLRLHFPYRNPYDNMDSQAETRSFIISRRTTLAWLGRTSLLSTLWGGNYLQAPVQAAETPYGSWKEFLGTDLETPAFPDRYCNYFVYSFSRKLGDSKHWGLRITGEFPYARYLSFNIYSALKGKSLGALTDFQIKPQPNHINPFIAGRTAPSKNRQYILTVLPKEYSQNSSPNELAFDGQSIDLLMVMLRYYLPQGNAIGNVPLPKIEAFDARSQNIVQLPKNLAFEVPKPIFAYRAWAAFDTVVDSTLRFYRNDGGGQFDNADNLYLFTAVERQRDQVLLIRVKPPTYPTDHNMFNQTNVRYWSFNQGNAETATLAGMHDHEFKVAKDGFIYLAIGADRMRARAQQGGYNFMPWKAKLRKAFILYRNLLTNPSHPGNLAQVPLMDLKNPQNIYSRDAKNYIGDYAPTGRTVSQTDFMKNYGGMPSPGFQA
jgi:hypothetical protein